MQVGKLGDEVTHPGSQNCLHGGAKISALTTTDHCLLSQGVQAAAPGPQECPHGNRLEVGAPLRRIKGLPASRSSPPAPDLGGQLLFWGAPGTQGWCPTRTGDTHLPCPPLTRPSPRVVPPTGTKIPLGPLTLLEPFNSLVIPGSVSPSPFLMSQLLFWSPLLAPSCPQLQAWSQGHLSSPWTG